MQFSDTDFSLTPIQKPIAERAHRQKRLGIAMYMGTGKTVIGTWLLYQVFPVRVLILCPNNAIRVWENHIRLWFAGLDAQCGESTPYTIWRWRKKSNNAAQRKALWKNFTPKTMNVYITSPQGFLFDREELSRKYDVIIFDEAKRIRSRGSEVYKALKPLCRECTYFLPMTGTPGKEVGDFFTTLHLLNHRYFSSYWRLIHAFCYTQVDRFGGTEILGLKNKDNWYATLKQWFVFVGPKEAGKQPTARNKLYVRLDSEQQKLYDQLQESMIAFHDEGMIVAQNTMIRSLRYRQLFICPKILDPTIKSYGAALEDLITTLKDVDPHVVIFTPFTDAFPFIEERLRQEGHKSIIKLSGAVGADELMELLSTFRSTRGIVLCSIKYATAFSLEPAANCYFLGYESDPEDNAQAEERLNRLTTNYPVNAFYYIYEDTYDEDFFRIVDWEQRKMNLTLGNLSAPKI